MDRHHARRSVTGGLEERVVTFLAARRSASFLALADAFPTVPWRTLFRVLFRLRARNLVELRPLGWDYEVTICEKPGQGGIASGATRVSEVARPS